MLYYSMPALAAGFILDLMIGDPRWLYHPVCLIGNLIAFLEKILRKIFPKTDKGELAAGTVEVILVCLLSGGIPFLILHILYGISVWAGFALETFWCYQLLATKSLKTESMKVYDRLKNGTLDEARYAVSMIVGRDTQSLTEEGVTKAAVETVAENASDGVIAPMLYMAVGEGIEEAMKAGILGGFPVVGVYANVYDGSYHEVDSSEMAFHIAGSLAFKDAMQKAAPVLLEPIMKVEVTTPEDYMGDVIGDINSRRGRIEGMEDIGGGKMIRGYVPLSEMFGYATDLRSRTQGRGNYSMFFEKYEQVPKSVQEKILAKKD